MEPIKSPYNTKHGMHPVTPILFIFFATAIISIVFGMMLFPIVTNVCADQLLLAVANIGYGGVALLYIGLMLEAYNLYEHHQRHVISLVVVSTIMCIATAGLMFFVGHEFTC